MFNQTLGSTVKTSVMLYKFFEQKICFLKSLKLVNVNWVGVVSFYNFISSEFHTYSMDWNSDRIIFSIDGIEHYRYNPRETNANTRTADSESFLLHT